MTKFDKNYFVTSAHFDGQGRGFAVGFSSRRAAYYFASFILFGFAEVLSWDAFFEKYPHYFN